MKKVFYLYKSGELQRKDFSLLLQEKNGNVVYIPVEQINLIVCFGDVNLNKRVLGLLNSKVYPMSRTIKLKGIFLMLKI